MLKRDLETLVESAGLTVEGNETSAELEEALGYIVKRDFTWRNVNA